MVAAGAEVSSELLVGEDSVEHVDLVNSRLVSLVSDSGGESEGSSSEVDFPDQSLRSHHEGEGRVTEEASGPSVVGSTEVLSNLVNVISSSHSPFKVVVSEDVVRVGEGRGVVVGLSRLRSISINVVSFVNVNTVRSLGGRLSHVVVSGRSVTSEGTLGDSKQVSSLLHDIKDTTSLGYYKVNRLAISGVLLTRVLAKEVYILN